MPRGLRDCAEDSKILERASDLYAERPNRRRRYSRAGSAHRSEAKGRRIVLDLKKPNACQDAIAFLDRCETKGITLKNCPACIREWINGQRGES
jgi:hypothetical protein